MTLGELLSYAAIFGTGLLAGEQFVVRYRVRTWLAIAAFALLIAGAAHQLASPWSAPSQVGADSARQHRLVGVMLLHHSDGHDWA